MLPLIDLVSPWIQRTAGILLNHQNIVRQITLFGKLKHDELPREIKFDALYPKCNKSYISKSSNLIYFYAFS